MIQPMSGMSGEPIIPASIFGRSSCGISPIFAFKTISNDSTIVATSPASKPLEMSLMSFPSKAIAEPGSLGNANFAIRPRLL